MSRNGLLMFHQGWTDIVNCLPMINWYARRYDKLYVVLRADSHPMILFYIRGIRNVIPIFIPKHIIEVDWLTPIDQHRLQITGREFIGHYDIQRPVSDPLRGAYARLNAVTDFPFEKLFYESYNIPYKERVNSFELYRDIDAEEQYYKKHVKSEPYICVHTNPGLELSVNPEDNVERVELGGTTEVFFDAIRVLQHAKAIHVIDSVWAAVCYMIDGKYGMLENVPIFVYCHRDFHRMFTQPVHRPNWTIVGATTA